MKEYKTGKLRRTVLIFILIIAAIPFSSAQKSGSKEAQELREKLLPFFSPAAEFKDNYGDYRSPLKFYDGTSVTTPGEWKKRRQEILEKWHGMMGKWPPLIEHQEFVLSGEIKKEGFTRYNIVFEWLPGQKTQGYLLIPDGKGKKPAVITVYYEPETAIGEGSPLRDFAYQLAKRGFVTLSIGTTETTKNQTYSLYYPGISNSQAQPLSLLACAAANAWHLLAGMPQVDSKKIGITGHSYGGKWSMFASCLYEKFACAVWSDPGIVFDEARSSVNYWEPWYLGYYPPPWRKRGIITEQNPAKGLYPELVAGGYDLHELHSLMAPRPFLVSGGSEDSPKRWVPLNHTVAVNKLLGYENRVAMTNRPEHSPNVESNEYIYNFFEYFLKHGGVQKKR